MKFSEIVKQAAALLQEKGRITYRVLKREFHLDEEQLEDLKEDLLFSHPEIEEADGRGLVWTGGEANRKQTPAQEDSRSTPSDSLNSHVPAPRPQPTAVEGDRRQLTVMFCDLVSSTVLSTQLDPEDLHAIVSAYQAACRQVIERYEGYIAQYLGDGILVYFGYPAAHEDDARRAVQTGLEILEQLPTLELSHPVQARIGIHTGHVVIGTIGGAGKTEQLALGETPNIAARVQGKAAPNTVVMSQATYRLVQGYFACQDLGAHGLKGLPAPLTLYEVQGEGEAQNRFDVSVQKGLTPLVGREEESELLHRRWERAKAGDGQVVLLSGEAGIGKSRLVQVLWEQIADEPQFSAVFRCSAFYQNSAFYPVIDRLEKFLQFAKADTAEAKLAKLSQALEPVGMTDAETLALFAALLSLPLPDDHPPLQLTSQKQKEKTLHALASWLRKVSAQQPVRLEFEDLHWADPSTLELLGLFIDQVARYRVLVLLTYRPEFTPPWPLQAYMLTLQLSRLPHQQISDMVQRIAGKALPAEILQQLITKSDGVPLYIEEVTKNLLESGLLKDVDGHYETTGPVPQMAIPTTLQDSFASRLDRLAPVRELAQIGAVLGREFSYELIRAVAQLDEGTLQAGLQQLGAAEILYQRGVPPEASYTFKHALLQDASYESLLKSRRQQLHTQAAQVLEQNFAETVQTYPELIAHHYTEATLIEKALPFWKQAGQHEMQRSAHIEANNHLSKGLALVETLPDTPARASQELSFLIPIGASFISTRGYAVSEVERIYNRAHALCQQLGETPETVMVLHGLRIYYLMRGELPHCIRTRRRQRAPGSKRRGLCSLPQFAHDVRRELLLHGKFPCGPDAARTGHSRIRPRKASGLWFCLA